MSATLWCIFTGVLLIILLSYTIGDRGFEDLDEMRADSARCLAEEALATVIEPAVDQAEFDRWVRFGLVTHQAALMRIPSTVHAAFADQALVLGGPISTSGITLAEQVALHRMISDDVIEIQSFGGETFTRRIQPPKPLRPAEHPRPFREWISDLHQEGVDLADKPPPLCLCADCRAAREIALDACVDR